MYAFKNPLPLCVYIIIVTIPNFITYTLFFNCYLLKLTLFSKCKGIIDVLMKSKTNGRALIGRKNASVKIYHPFASGSLLEYRTDML